MSSFFSKNKTSDQNLPIFNWPKGVKDYSSNKLTISSYKGNDLSVYNKTNVNIYYSYMNTNDTQNKCSGIKWEENPNSQNGTCWYNPKSPSKQYIAPGESIDIPVSSIQNNSLFLLIFRIKSEYGYFNWAFLPTDDSNDNHYGTQIFGYSYKNEPYPYNFNNTSPLYNFFHMYSINDPNFGKHLNIDKKVTFSNKTDDENNKLTKIDESNNLINDTQFNDIKQKYKKKLLEWT